MRPLIALIAFALPVLAAPLPKELRKSDQELILGTWERTAETRNGEDVTDSLGIKWVFKKDGTADILLPDGKNNGPVNWKIDPEVKVKTFDWKFAGGNQFLGVYELDGDTLRIALPTTPGQNERSAAVVPSARGTYKVFKRCP